MGKGATEEPVPSTPAWEESAASTAAAWSDLSRACHHHPYELAPTANELRDVLDIAHRFAAEVTRQSCPRRYYARTSTIRADCIH